MFFLLKNILYIYITLMDFNKKILDKINLIINLSASFDSGFKIIFELENNTLDEKNIDILYSMTKNYIQLRKEHGEIILMFNKLSNSIILDEIVEESSKKTTQSKGKEDLNTELYNSKLLYDISTFNSLLNNINDLINNIDYEYKKIAVKYPKFINKNQILIILITLSNSDEKYINMINELKKEYLEHKYKVISLENKSDISKYEKELNDYGIKTKSIKSLPLIYILNGGTLSKIPLSKFNNIEPIKGLLV
jgi:hypothetical protein